MNKIATVILCCLVGGLFCFNILAATEYKHGPDSERHDGVPVGRIEKFKFTSPKIFAGTQRDCAIYIPAQYDGKEPAAVMVFQDGIGYTSEKGDWRIPIVFDNLIHKKDMPTTIGVFVNPGTLSIGDDKKVAPRVNRSYEYDTPSDQYVRFLMDEILPYVEKEFKLNLTKDGNMRGICGSSSGGIAAFTAAWERPNEFRRVISTIGSFTSLHGGGNNYPSMIRKSEPRPIRVFLEEGTTDLNNFAGDWYLANQEMLSALKYANYEVAYEWREGAHSGKHGAPLMPDMLRYVWKDFAKPVATPVNTTQLISSVIIPGEGWQLVSEGHKFTEGPAVDADGIVYFTDIPNNKIHKIGLDGKVTVFASDTKSANGLMFGPDGKLYCCANGAKQIVAYDKNAKIEVIADGVESNDICINAAGEIYFTEPTQKQIWHISAGKREKKIVDKGLGFANGITFTADQGQLIVADSQSPNLYLYKIETDGSLSHKQPYYIAHLPGNDGQSGADGIRVDIQGRLFVATKLGVQMFDQSGRVAGILTKPQPGTLANLVFGGPKFDTLYVCAGNKIFKRKVNTTGANNWQSPIIPQKQK